MAQGNRFTTSNIEDLMSRLAALRRSGAAVLTLSVALLAVSACKPSAPAQNNIAASLIVDGNYDDANFVVPGDEGSGDENASIPADPATADPAGGASPATNTARPHSGSSPRH